ncbi:DUF6672 family protein [Treponema pedis]|uniref:DUF6672 family protein n=1 Tax=Treponema pedis TaxID=409322 RepID=UPI0004127A77|nr:DUF6672 family protein [Treponema pedis]
MIRIQSKKLKLILRISLGVCYVMLAVLMFVSGRTHTVLFENKKADDGSFTHLGSIEISFDGKEPQELFKGERDKILLRGQKHKIIVNFTDGREPFKGEFKIPLFEDTVLLSIPALVNKIPKAVIPFESESDAPKEE